MNKESIANLIIELNSGRDNNVKLDNRVKSIERKIKNRFNQILQNFEIYIDHGNLYLADIKIDPKYRNNGYGKKIISMLKSFCKTNKILLFLIPVSEEDSDQKRLLKFYKKLGFKKNHKQNINSAFEVLKEKRKIIYYQP